MQKLSVIAVLLLFVIASCTKKSVPTTAGTKEPAPKETVLDGAPLYAQNCAHCHGATGVEGRAPNLKSNDFTKKEMIDQISKGSGRMPAFATKLSAHEIEAVAEFTIHLKK